MPSEDAQVAVYRAALATAAGVQPKQSVMVRRTAPVPIMDGEDTWPGAGVWRRLFLRAWIGQATWELYGIGGDRRADQRQFCHCGTGWCLPLLHFNRLPDELSDVETGLFVPQAVTPWPNSNDPHPAGRVSSFRMSRTNVHAIVGSRSPHPSSPGDARWAHG